MDDVHGERWRRGASSVYFHSDPVVGAVIARSTTGDSASGRGCDGGDVGLPSDGTAQGF